MMIAIGHHLRTRPTAVWKAAFAPNAHRLIVEKINKTHFARNAR
jgi:hypothetical protein